MGSTYQIIILNHSGGNQQYLLFNDPPVPTPNTTSTFSSVWIQTSGTPSPNGSQELTIRPDTFAMCGTLPAPLATNVVVQEGDFTAVTLAGPGQLGTVPIMAIVEDGPAFQPPPDSTSAANSFGITTKAWDNDEYQDKLWFGMGKYNENQDVVPVATFPALPSQSYTLQPGVQFYVGTGSYQPGKAVNITDIGQIANIDFNEALSGQTIATITHLEDLTYSRPTFSFPGE